MAIGSSSAVYFTLAEANRGVARPAVALVEVSRLYGPDFPIEIEAFAAA